LNCTRIKKHSGESTKEQTICSRNQPLETPKLIGRVGSNLLCHTWIFLGGNIMTFVKKSHKYGNKEIIVDDEDAHIYTSRTWYLHYQRGSFYCVWNSRSKGVKRLHREIMRVNDPSIQVDHINHNTLDNRKCNLRKCTNAQNGRNRVNAKNSSSGFKGVTKQKNKYRGRIQVDGKMISLGMYKNKESAAIAYNVAAIKYFGEFALLNSVGQVTQ
jgi:hypothetical protein